MKVNFSILCFIFLFYTSVAQDITLSQYRGELNIKLEVIDEKRLDKGLELLNSALLMEKEALAILSSMDDEEKNEGSSTRYKKMLKYFMDASEKFGEGHTLIYMVYDENCQKFMEEMKKMNHYASGLNKAKYYERKAVGTMNRADAIREILKEADKPEWIQYKMHEAFELEKLAIRDLGRALQIYQDFPVEYDYGWINDVSQEELARFYKNPVVNLPPEEVFKNIDSLKKKEPEGGTVVFRVQIAAHTVQIGDEYIKTFYTGTDSIMEINEGRWFKYQIGNFDNYQDADKLRISCRVPRAFVVAYQDEKKLTIKDALALLQAVQ